MPIGSTGRPASFDDNSEGLPISLLPSGLEKSRSWFYYLCLFSSLAALSIVNQNQAAVKLDREHHSSVSMGH